MASAKTTSRKPQLSTIQAKKEVLDYLITTLDYIESNLPEDLSEVDGEERPPADIVRILAAIHVLREEFTRRTRPKTVRVPENKPITREDLDRAQAFLRRAREKMDLEAKAREKYGDGVLGDYFTELGAAAFRPGKL